MQPLTPQFSRSAKAPEGRSSWSPGRKSAPYLAVFLFINLLFAFKFGSRLSLTAIAAGALFTVFFGLQLAGGTLLTVWAVHRRCAGFWLWAVLTVYLVAAYAVYRSMDPYALKADRWSILEAFYDTLFRGEFPWTATSHLGTNVSLYPGMHALALPFYLLGDVGLLQFAGLIAFVALMVVRYRESARPLYLLGMVLAMPVVQYQVFTRSDLLGNSIAIAWLMYGSLRPGAARGWRLFGWAAVWGLALSTRSIFVIPFIFVMWHLVEGRGFKAIAGVAIAAASVFLATFAPFYLWDPVLFWTMHPYRVQSHYVTREVLVFILATSVVLGYVRRRSQSAFLHTGMMIFLTVFLCWIVRSAEIGWGRALFVQNGFDLSYFFLCVPFLILSFGDLLPSSRRGEAEENSRL